MLLDGPATRYSTHMKVTIDLSQAQGERLRREAERLGLTPEDLARAAVADLLATRDDDFEAAAKRVLQKNEGLYRRLAGWPTARWETSSNSIGVSWRRTA